MNMDTYNLDAMNEVGCSSGLDEASAMPSLLGDFYYEPDDVTRGLTLFDTPGILTLFDTPGHSLTRLSDSLTPLTRLSDGLTLFDTPGMGMNTDCSKGTGRSGDTPGMGMDTDISQCTVGIAQVQTFDQFVGTDILPVVPADEFWTCGATTLYIQCDRPASLMNTFLQFLQAQVVHNKLKVTIRKYAIKADVYIDNVRCTLKARAYQQEPGKIATEAMQALIPFERRRCHREQKTCRALSQAHLARQHMMPIGQARRRGGALFQPPARGTAKATGQRRH